MKKLTKKELWTDIGIVASLFTIAGLLMYLLSSNGIYQFEGKFVQYVNPVPSAMNKGLSVVASINKFGGDPIYNPEFISDQYIPWMIAVGTSIVFTFMVVPLIFMLAFKSLKSGKRNVAYYAGITLMVWVIGVNITTFPRGIMVSMNTWDSAAQSRQIDKAREHLANVAYLAAEELVLSYDWDVNEKGELQIRQNIGNNLTEVLKGLEDMDTDQFDIVINKEKSDSTLVMHLVIEQDSKHSQTQNINGEKGKRELVLEVVPQKDRIIDYIKSNPN